MKKTFGILLAVAFLASCGSNKKEENAANGDVEVATEEVVVATTDTLGVPDMSNAQGALDYEGTYEGIIPSASGSGIKIVITLTGNNYTKDESYVGVKNSDTHTTGTYTWNDAGNVITLVNDEKPNQYFVGENTLTMLNMDGQKVTGDIGKEYILHKQQ